MLAPDGRPWLIDFGFAEIAATDQMLDTDVAELLSSTALKVGVDSGGRRRDRGHRQGRRWRAPRRASSRSR